MFSTVFISKKPQIRGTGLRSFAILIILRTSHSQLCTRKSTPTASRLQYLKGNSENGGNGGNLTIYPWRASMHGAQVRAAVDSKLRAHCQELSWR
jgi:hypothetical protein